MGLSLSSFYYFFLESLTLAVILFNKYKQNLIKNIITQFKYYKYLIFTFS